MTQNSSKRETCAICKDEVEPENKYVWDGPPVHINCAIDMKTALLD